MRRVYRFIFGFFIAILVSGLFSFPIFAQDSDIVINEFLIQPTNQQWVELYNKGNDSVDISGWVIDDSETGSTAKYTIPASTSISSHEFKVFEDSHFDFNYASGDKARLLHGAIVIDSYDYTSGSGSGKTYGRSIDGGGMWVVFANPTKGSSNNNSIADPTATFTPPPSTLPTTTSKLTPTQKPSPTKLLSLTPSQTPHPTLTKATSEKFLSIVSSTPSVLGLQTENKISETPIDPSEQHEIAISQPPTPLVEGMTTSVNSSILFIGIGIIFSIFGIITYLWKAKKAKQKQES